MSSPLRILHCMRTPVGGLFRHVSDLAREQSRRGHLVGVVCDSSTGDGLTEQRLSDLAPALRLGVARFAMARELSWRDRTAYLAIRAHAQKLAVNVLHGHGAKGGAFARLAAGSLGRHGRRPATFYTPHGGSLHYGSDTVMGRMYMALERRLLSDTDGLIFESGYAHRAFAAKIGVGATAHRVIPNGLHETEFATVEADGDAADFLFLGELSPIKGVDVLLAALRLLNDRQPTRALIVGDGKSADELRKLAVDLQLDGVVTFAGAMPIRQALARGRCMVMPSRAESLPYVALETVAAGVPLIASDVGGLPEIVAGSDATLVTPGDPHALASAMQAVLSAPEVAAEQARTLRRAIGTRFNVTAMTSGVLDFYDHALSPRAAA